MVVIPIACQFEEKMVHGFVVVVASADSKLRKNLKPDDVCSSSVMINSTGMNSRTLP